MQPGIKEYFSRQIQLWGEDTQENLQNKSIAIIGAGGLGSSLCFALGSSGIGTLHVVDFDEINLHNIHRQIAFGMDDVGKNKADINAKTIQKRNPFADVISHECDFKEWCKKDIKVDLILDATDNLQTRDEIDKYSKKQNIPWIYGSVEAFNGQVCFFDKASFGSVFKLSNHTPKGVAAPMVMYVASLQANIALRYFCELKIQKDTLHYLFFNENGEQILQKFAIFS